MLNPISIKTGSVADAAAAGSPPVGYPVSVDLVRQHCRIDTDIFDELIAIYLPGAIEWIENETHRTMIRRDHVWILREFPCDDPEIRLPRGKTASVESIVYISGGEAITLSGPSSMVPGEDYQEDLRDEDGGVLRPLRGESWPSVDCDAIAPVVITFTAGETTMPANLKRATMFLVADQISMPGSEDFGTGKSADAIAGMISQYCLHRNY